MADHVVLRRLLWAMTSICLAVALMAIPIIGDEAETVDASAADGAADVRSADDDGDESSPPASDAEAGDQPGATDDTGAAGDDPVTADPAASPAPSAATTLPPPDAGLGAPTDPGPPVPPRAGRYRYRTTGGDDAGEESTTTVAERGREGDETRLSVTTTGGQLTSTNEVVWRPDGVRTLRSTLTFGERQADCDWEPDLVEAVFPLAAGATWTSASQCSITGLTPAPIVLERSSTSKVVELRRIVVAGTPVDVWVIERTERLSGGGRSEEGSAVAFFSPRHGVDVELRGTVSGRDYTRQLVSLEPEAG